ncbi:MAG: ATP-dependent DNA helicase [DPANN group archaeon]|nr:ATP-dependent DNA helicase [DPANN group archaeon]
MLSSDDRKSLLFPYAHVRAVQQDMLKKVRDIIESGKSAVIHAPTGLGKTVSTLGPALSVAKKKDLTIYFLTSRHTQHKIAIETLQHIKEAHLQTLVASDMIGKRWMCLQPGIKDMRGGDFNEYCKRMREDHACAFYSRARQKNGKFTVEAKVALEDMKRLSPIHTERIFSVAEDAELCPYEMAALLSASSRVIVADYLYLFDPGIRQNFLNRIGKDLSDAVIIVDEGHNLPGRIRDLASVQLSSYVILQAIKEAKKHAFPELIEELSLLQDILVGLSRSLELGGERLVRRDQFMDGLGTLDQYDDLIDRFEEAADTVREEKKQSFLGRVSAFLTLWKGEDDGYVRTVDLKQGFRQPLITLKYKCLDPSLLTAPVIKDAHSTIIMSGTLSPTGMYRDVLGFPDDSECITYGNPFPMSNRLSLIVPRTTTKFTLRSDRQYKDIAEHCSRISAAVPGNLIIFFPSYFLMREVGMYFRIISKKTVMEEDPRLTKDEKFEMLETFKTYKDAGAVLLAVSSANFAEGIDLPGDLLKGVIVVGLPLHRPDLETKALIDYYDRRFAKGWLYGYVLPAFNKTLQGAGRCIRSETDKGVIVFLDERYAWPNYRQHFPEDMGVNISIEPETLIQEFFGS